jgi:uncharacterized repeat protein (TIGR03803 family)
MPSNRNLEIRVLSAIRGVLTLAVFSALLLVAPRPVQAQTETVLYNFTGGSDGANPQSNLTSDGAGNFYGTTMNGGLFGFGTVFEISPNGSGGWNETVLYSFTGGADGANPIGPVIFDSVGNLYGTTEYGGPYRNSYGVVFELSPVGAGWTETVLYSFLAGGQGNNPQTGLIMGPTGNLYGITQEGVFELSPSAGGWTYQDIYIFAFGGAAGLTMDAAGNIFGVSSYNIAPFAFELSPNGIGGWNPTKIYDNFGAAHPEGTPRFIPYQGTTEMLFGTTEFGGGKKLGTVYMLWNIEIEKGKWVEQGIYGFQGGKDGSYPYGGVVFGAFYLPMYGTTTAGGQYNAGTVFEIGTGWKEKVLWSFNGTDGAQPYGSLILDSAGNLYGTASAGGSSGAGVVFEVTPAPVTATTTTIVSSLNPSLLGQAVTFTATVTSAAGSPPNGELVTFYDGTRTLGSVPLSSGMAAYTTSTLSAKAHTIKATYAGDATFIQSYGTVTQVVNFPTKPATATTLASSLNPSIYGQKVIWTATVTTSGSVPPTGTVNFTWDGNSIGGAALNASGVATLTKSLLNADSYPLTAVYLGDTNNLGSTSPILNQVIQQATSAATLTSSPNPSTQGQAVTFTATITSPTVTPTGPVTFTAGKNVLGTVELSKGKATFTTSTLAVGSTTVTVTYPWNSNVAASSASVTQTVEQ